MSKAVNGITETTFEFFEGLENNNNRDWFDEHRDTYHEYARDPLDNSSRTSQRGSKALPSR